MTRTTQAAPDDQIRADELTRVFAVPGWLRDLGLTAWLLLGVTLLLVGVMFLLSLTDAIVMPVVTATIAGAVLSPVVRWLHRWMPRSAAAAVLLLLVLAAAVGFALLILAGVVGEADKLTQSLSGAADKLRGYLEDAGVQPGAAADAESGASSAVSAAFKTLLGGLGVAITGLASLAVFASFTVLSLFFLLKDGPVIRSWTERHMGVPASVARVITGRTLDALRGYFAGVTAIALFNAVIIGLGAVVLDLPHAGSIALVNFVCAYVPYLGAWSAGAFTVLIALGSQGPDAALAMIVITLLANGALQQMIQPIAFGATLGIHPLGVLIVTIGAGALFGTIGLVLAAPLTSAALRVSADLAQARAGITRSG